MPLLLHHYGFHLDSSPSISHLSFPQLPTCSVLALAHAPHTAATAIAFKSQVRSCLSSAQNPSVLPSPDSFRVKSMSGCQGPTALGPTALLTSGLHTHCFPAALAGGSLLTIPPAAVVKPQGFCISSSFCLGISRRFWPSSEISWR